MIMRIINAIYYYYYTQLFPLVISKRPNVPASSPHDDVKENP